MMPLATLAAVAVADVAAAAGPSTTGVSTGTDDVLGWRSTPNSPGPAAGSTEDSLVGMDCPEAARCTSSVD